MSHKVDYKIENDNRGIHCCITVKPSDRVKEANITLLLRQTIHKIEDME